MSQPSSPTLIAAGILLAGKYRLVRPLGEGAMGSVWAAVNEATDRDVALKLILRPEPEFRHRLQREARALGALKHKNVIDVIDIDQTDAGDPFLVMEMLLGETLAERLARKRRLDATEAIRIARDVAKGLSAAHAIHIVHRDLKPANIFLHRATEEEPPVVKVLDFGVAKNLAVSDGMRTAVGSVVGSPLYMSPEQVRMTDVDHRADIWSLGVVLFETLTGVRPFDGDAHQVFAKILAGHVPAVDRYVRRIDPALVQLVSRCMRRDKAERYKSASEVAAELDRIGSGAAVAGEMSTSSTEWGRVSSPTWTGIQPRPSSTSSPSYSGVLEQPLPASGPPALAALAGAVSTAAVLEPKGSGDEPSRPSPGEPVPRVITQQPSSQPLSQPSSPDLSARRESDESSSWAQGGTVRMTSPVPANAWEAINRGQRSAASLVPITASATAHGSPLPGAGGTAPVLDRRRRSRLIAAIAGVVVTLAMIGGSVLLIIGREHRAAPAEQPGQEPPATGAPGAPPPPEPPEEKAPEEAAPARSGDDLPAGTSEAEAGLAKEDASKEAEPEQPKTAPTSSQSAPAQSAALQNSPPTQRAREPWNKKPPPDPCADKSLLERRLCRKKHGPAPTAP